MMSQIMHSKTYREVLEHRGLCPYWQQTKVTCVPCLDCFGGGLTNFTTRFLDEIGLLKKAEVNLMRLKLPEYKPRRVEEQRKKIKER